jgi:hypothetical protein
MQATHMFRIQAFREERRCLANVASLGSSMHADAVKGARK